MDSGLAYVARRFSPQLLRLDLISGASQDVLDLGDYDPPDGIVEIGSVAAHEGHVFEAATRRRLTGSILPTSGTPTDIELLCEGVSECGLGCGPQGCPPLHALSSWGLVALSVLRVGAAIGVLGRRLSGALPG